MLIWLALVLRGSTGKLATSVVARSTGAETRRSCVRGITGDVEAARLGAIREPVPLPLLSCCCCSKYLTRSVILGGIAKSNYSIASMRNSQSQSVCKKRFEHCRSKSIDPWPSWLPACWHDRSCGSSEDTFSNRKLEDTTKASVLYQIIGLLGNKRKSLGYRVIE